MPQVELTALLGTIDGIYAAASGEAGWPSAIRRIRDLVGASRACIVEADAGGLRATSNEVADDPAYTSARGFSLYIGDPIAAAESRMPLGRPYQWGEIVDIAALRGRPLWNEFYGPMGLHQQIGCRLAAGDATVTLHVTRTAAQEGFDAAERNAIRHIVPHMVRAGRIAQEIGGTQALSGWEALPFAVLLVDGSCRLERANEAARALLARGAPVALRGGRIALSAGPDQAELERLVGAVCRGGEVPHAGGTVLLRAGDEARTAGGLVLEVSALRTGARFGVRSAVRAAIHIRELRPVLADPAIAGLRDRFDLSKAEARLTAELVAGHSLRDAAQRCGVTFGTARNYLLQIFRKTGTGRQADLVDLMRAYAAWERQA